MLMKMIISHKTYNTNLCYLPFYPQKLNNRDLEIMLLTMLIMSVLFLLFDTLFFSGISGMMY